MRLEEGGWARQTTIRELPSSPTIAGVNMRLKAGAIREMHWHKESESSYMLKGKTRVTCVDQEGRAFQDDVSEGDLWFFPAGVPHSIQGLEDDGCEFLLVFDNGNFSRIPHSCSPIGWRIPLEISWQKIWCPRTCLCRYPQT